MKPKLRAHLRVRRHVYRGQVWYILDDGATGRVHRFPRGAYLLIGRLDGTHTVNGLWECLVDEIGEDAPTQDDVIRALGMLHGSDLLASDATPNTAELFKRQKKQKRQVWLQNLKSPMSLRFPLVDPDRFLTRTMPWLQPLFGWFGLVLWLVLVISALVLAGANWDELTGNLWDRALAADNLFIMAFVYPAVKIAHELGHGYAAKMRGREVREMGVMLLLLFPVPYVDASAAGALASKWQRALIGAAGMLTELLLAAVAMFLWVMVEPGVFRAILFNVMLVAGISTILVNGNPLLKFDGYFILSDLIEIPNLAQRSNKYWGDLMSRHVFKTPGQEEFAATRAEKRWFIVYAPAAFFARMAMMLGIALLVAKKFFFIGVAISIWTLWTSIALPVWKMYAHVFTSPQLQRNRRRAVQWTVGATAALMLGLFVIPAPHHVTTQGIVWLPEAAHVRAGGDGVIDTVSAREGQQVRAGELLVETANPILDEEVEKLRWRARELQAKADTELRAGFGDAAGDRVLRDVGQIEVAEAIKRLAVEQNRLGDLSIEAGTSGRFVLAAATAADLPGRHVRKGELIGYVTPGSADVARIAVPQDDFELIRGRLDSLKLKIADRPVQTFDSAIVRAVPGGTFDLPSPALATTNGGPFALDPTAQNGPVSLTRVFLFDVALPATAETVPFGTRVHVRFQLDWEPLGWQLFRRVRQLLLSQFDA
ncbi:site-2 protease family protein [Sphingomonas radiodurans]|uniref:site-2 protease family protein n=1 Tax=Sphingomonas radiodurans TaxID=2890321 RepID=UPI001E53A956|nr:site-2 protease family protein [Sphingomonas radiodurans]WBH15001.1 peptidase M50 [Sphingomonas radiodurans]